MNLENNLDNYLLPEPLVAETGSDAVAEMYPADFGDLDHPSINSRAKWLIDKLGAAVLLIACSPVMALAAVLIKATSRGPVIFKSERLGRHEKTFIMYKFRTMRHRADGHERALHSEAGSVFVKPDGDDRVTSVGAYLRRLSIDELPQLVNVLKGELSLVGPRPIKAYEAMLLPLRLREQRFSVQQGLTGLWQVSGRSDLPDEIRIALDHEYVERWSLALDWKIVFRTIGAVLEARGAR
jgi:lipopolysaccharide/colanic/teichoic acid biosynthesis glycosyltransferase